MNPVIHFQSRLFDVSKEPVNPINPIRGASLLDWFHANAVANFEMTAPESEDWGWYSSVDWEGRTYMIGACAHENPDGNHEWILQFEKSRTVKERLLGQAKLSAEDPCFSYFHCLIKGEPGFTDISIVYGP
jgi:hypothetical protein